MLQQQAFRHVEELHLGVVAAAHDASGEKFAGPADLGEHIGQQTAGGRFHDREPPFLHPQQIGADAGHGFVAETHEIVVEELRAI